MKNFKKFFILLVTGFILCYVVVLNSCKKKCDGEDPRARIVNNGTAKADVQIKTTNGNTININNILSGTASDYSSYAPGNITFTITIQGVAPVVKNFELGTCYEYDITIDASNNVTSTPFDRND